MQTLGITVTDAGGATAAALGFREATLDHGLGGFEEPLEELLLTHLKILRYNRSVLQSREKLHCKLKLFQEACRPVLQKTASPATGTKRLRSLILRQEVASLAVC